MNYFLPLIIGMFFSMSVNQLYSQCSVTSSNGYTVTFTFSQNAVNLTDYGNGSSCGFTVELDYTIQYSGPNQPGSLYSVNGTLNCSPVENSGFSLGNGAPGSGTVTTYNATYYGPCDDLILNCPITLSVQGPGIPTQTITGCGTVIYPFDAQNLLPVDLISFTGKLSENGIQLKWSTASEYHNKGFTIEKSLSGKHWERVGWVDGAGISSETQHYSFIDNNPFPSTNLYRLKQEDFDGKSEYSNVISVSNSIVNRDDILLYPNPAHSTLSFIVNNDQPIEEIVLYNQFGQKLSVNPIGNKLDISGLQSGIYTVVIKMESQFVTKRFIKS